MLGQFPEWFAFDDGLVVEEPPEELEELLEDWVVDVVAVELVLPPVAAFAIAAPPPMTAPARDSVTRASRSRCLIWFTSFRIRLRLPLQ